MNCSSLDHERSEFFYVAKVTQKNGISYYSEEKCVNNHSLR